MMMADVGAPRAGIRAKSRTLRILAAAAIAAAAALATVGPLAPATPANAAVPGPRYDLGLGPLGAWSTGGYNVYCLQIHEPAPFGSTSGVSYGGWGSLSSTDLARLNWAVSTYGQSSDRGWTAAVHLYVWSIADPVAYNGNGMSGDIYYSARAGSDQYMVRDRLAVVRAGAAGISAGATSGSGSMTFQVDPLDNYAGTLTIATSPGSASGTVTLTNGVFTDVESSTIAGVGPGVYPIRGVPPVDASPYKIHAEGTFSGTGGYRGEIGRYSTAGAQTLAGPGRAAGYSFNLSADDPMDRATAFSPVLGSVVDDRFLEPGDSFADTFTFDVAEDPATGLTNSWLRYDDGDYAAITARVSVYKTTSPIVVGDPIPPDAELFDSFTVTTSEADGPTVPYTVSTTSLVDDSAYYVAVSEIRAEDQSAGVQLFLPTDYFWTDGWGVASEVAIVPPTATTEATALQGTGLPLVDVATFDGLLFDGAQVQFHAYSRPAGGTPLVSDDPEAIDPEAVCDASTLAFTSSVLPLDAAVIRSDEAVLAPGLYDWTVTLLDGGGTEVWTAPCGVVSERSEVRQLVVSTVAQTDLVTGADFYDTATLWGTIDDGDTITFEAFSAAHDTAGEPVCEADNLVWTSPAIELDAGVVDALDVSSAPTKLGVGTYWWVETVRHSSGEVVHAGACGIASETSRTLAMTGTADTADMTIAGFVLLALGGGALVGSRRRRRLVKH